MVNSQWSAACRRSGLGVAPVTIGEGATVVRFVHERMTKLREQLKGYKLPGL